MKTILALILFLFAVPSQADEWTKADSVRESLVLLTFFVDYRQTKDSLNKPGYVEINPILGENPSSKRVSTYFGLASLAHVGIAYALPRKWREVFQYTTIGYEAGVVFRNNSVGLSVNF